ncbi:protease [Fimbriimonas ginsengisoli Gsoil 348]|uniref:Tricorn protease homolog n=2 Tax=Fimbriimonas ginsengisoli TaxID=1005039 RepID=A0A068NRQ6_FIMGI|nr:protease [Fimbriimonas ginsengisoli Gsoil 348]
MQPSIRGNDIVFVSQGDLWRVGIDGGLAHALTGHVAPASYPAISPDGKAVAFTGTYEGPTEAYTMSLDGELPRRITYEGGMNVAGWTPDGRVIVATGIRSTLPNTQLMTIDPATRKSAMVPLAQASDGCYDPTGKTLFFTRMRFQGSHTKRYQGGTAQGIWKYTEGSPEAVNLTKSYAGTSKDPMWWNGRIYFLTDRDGSMNLWSMAPDGTDLKQVTKNENWDIQSASIDKGRVVYQLGADLHLVDVTTGEDKKLDVTLESDFEGTRDRWQKDPLSYMNGLDVSADGSKVALTARGQVFVAPVEPGRFVEVSRKPGVRYRGGMFSADGKWVYALSDQSGETEWWKMPANGVGFAEQITTGSKVLNMGGKISPDGKRLAYYNKDLELWIVDLATKVSTKVASSLDDTISDFAWSPDSKWLAYVMPSSTFSRINLLAVATGKSTTVTTDRADSTSPAWSADGKWLYFLSDRTFRSLVGSPWGTRQPEPFFDRQTKIYALSLVKGLRSPFEAPDELTPVPAAPAKTGPVNVEIDLDGIQGRLWEVPVPASNYNLLSATAERLIVQDASLSGPRNLVVVDIKDRDVTPKVLVPSIGGYQLSQDGKKLVVFKDGKLFPMPASAPVAAMDKPVDLSGWNFAVQPREEWRQMFAEAWRLERDYFYDRNMHSVDWNRVRKQYEPLVDRVRDRSELSNLLAQMVSELSALHIFVYGGDNRRSPDSVGIGYLGGLLTRDAANGGFRIEKIYQGDPDYPETLSPLVRPGTELKAGDTILAVNGVDTMGAPDIGALLRNQAGKQVLLHVKDGITAKERDVIVRPISGGQANDLQYTDWEISRRRQVESASNNTIGYVHLRAMGSGDIATWERDFYPVFNRSGLIVDVRHNGGGNIDSWILEKLIRKAWFYWQPRIGNPYWNMQSAFRGHVVVLCDEGTGSDGEAFTEGIRRLGIGKIIGTRTWGGEVWLSSSNFLGDGGIATAAEYGVYGPEGKWLIEGHGVDPDFVVDNLPHATFLGKDAQLEAALAYLAKEIKDKPVPVPPAPKYPNKAFPQKKIG